MTAADEARRILLACEASDAGRARAVGWVAAMGWGVPPAGACGWMDNRHVLTGIAGEWFDRGARIAMVEYDAAGLMVAVVSMSPESLTLHALPLGGLLATREGGRRLRAGAPGEALVVVGSAWQWLRAACRWEPEGVAVYGVRSMICARQLGALLAAERVAVVGESGSEWGRALTASVVRDVRALRAGDMAAPVDAWWTTSGGGK